MTDYQLPITNYQKRIIGLTGGISTGKSTVSQYLAHEYHLPVLDADIYAREAVQLGSPILNAIAQRYGKNILQADGTLDRQQLARIIFNNSTEKQWLERQIHPYVRDRFEQEINKLSVPIVVLVIPLLFEAEMTDLVTEIWVVACSPQQQIDRLIQRDNLTVEQAQARINSQMPLSEKCDRADVVLDNSSTLEDLKQQVDLAIKKFNSSIRPPA
ncbi:MAG: Dephospho-CoA kinase [Chroococcidiopsis cubana SAG 39.79]|uniref:dephospho-CoA kinase n=1 Tax=Chroococcidiopsis cubana TaxID=171392 RepID=UPI000D04E308|nr:dephospho-CoA kinase [Chroococcidiopsis cubana]MBE9020565.1 dephospho-CoA kinase [Chroococcidiopsidales cyanobacterium LEGE 13417]MDZ4871901.1 Dephospho-CoA kinase [Chroococcidiopsis cubana SAG 39.79]PSB54511.1 dephospho-CoA kinase [Chroococcidiopsis cubana CCALA 043]